MFWRLFGIGSLASFAFILLSLAQIEQEILFSQNFYMPSMNTKCAGLNNLRLELTAAKLDVAKSSPSIQSFSLGIRPE
jgi:hypothetical protein